VIELDRDSQDLWRGLAEDFWVRVFGTRQRYLRRSFRFREMIRIGGVWRTRSRNMRGMNECRQGESVFELRLRVLMSKTVMPWLTLARLKARSQVPGLFLRQYTSGDPQRCPGLVKTDDCAIPLKPVWSVDDLLSSYPRPTISSSALRRLHVLSALIPPEEGTPEHIKLSRELEDLVKLVESVRLFNAPDASNLVDTAVDARVWAQGTGIDLEKPPPGGHGQEALDPTELLSWASRTADGLYVIHSDRAMKKSVFAARSTLSLTDRASL
jgi:hypothetical protein